MSKVVLIGPVYPYRGGIAHYTTNLDQALRQSCLDVLTVSFSRQYPRRLFPGASDRDASAAPRMVEEAQFWIDSLNPLTWLATFRKICRYAPDRVILQWWTGYWAPVWLCLLWLNRLFLHAPVTFICHNVLPHDRPARELAVTRQVLRHAQRCIVHSDDERERLRQILPHMPVSVVPMPLFDVFDRYRLPQEEARRRLDLPPGSPILLFFGIVRPYKGLEDLLRALPEIRRRLPDARLAVAGEFWKDRAFYDELLAELDIGDIVRIDDRYVPDEEVGLYFSAADVLVLPYRRASGSAALRAAHSFGLRIVATDVARAQATDIPPAQIAWTPAGDPEQLANAICSILLALPVSSTSSQFQQPRGADVSWQMLATSIMDGPSFVR